MNFDFTDEEKKIFDLLKSQGCCLRCCLRFSGCRNAKQYQDLSWLKTSLQCSSDNTQNTLSEVPCITCFGILQPELEKTIIERITIEVKKQNYDCTTFTCALTIPVSICLRERFLYILIGNESGISKDTINNCKSRMPSVKDVWKWVVISNVEKSILKNADFTSPSPFLIEIVFTFDGDERECCALLEKFEKTNGKSSERKRKYDGKYSRKRVETLMADISDEQFEKNVTYPLLKVDSPVTIGNVLCSHSSIFIGGRYTKLSRELSQTPWYINGEKKMETSVQDILCEPIAKVVQAESIKFLSSGREDVDVRNIYSGRPFAVELLNPKVTNITEELLSELVTVINSSSKLVQITTCLKVLNKDDLKRLKEGENVKTKFYRALCICRTPLKDKSNLEKLNDMKNVKTVQKTPIRVLHRRPLAPRERLIYEMRARWVKSEELKSLSSVITQSDAMFFVLDVKTQAGTYVKEFVHGDFGRTKPSLCDLLNAEVDIVALDVTGINLNWP